MTVRKTLHYADAHSPREMTEAQFHANVSLKIAYNTYIDDRYLQPKDGLNLIFSHGAQMCKELWEYTIEMFFNDPVLGPRLATVVAIDAIGHGDSYLANRGKLTYMNTWQDSARDIIQVTRQLKLTGVTILVGHSMGGTQSMYAALFDPGLFDSVVTIDPMGFNDRFMEPSTAKNLGNLFDNLVANQARDQFKDRIDYETYINEVGLSKNFHPRCKKDYMDASAVKNVDGSYTFKTAAVQQLGIYMSGQYAFRDSVKVVGHLDCAILHVFPTDGYLKGSKAFRAAMRHGTFVDIPDSTHLVPFEKPVETFNAMRGFILQRLERGTQLEKTLQERTSWTLQLLDEYNKMRLAAQMDGLRRGERIMPSKL
jgi:pimeloyl-ACP methyl ester carboxylesterase